MHDAILIILFPSSPVIVFAAAEIVIVPSLLTVAVSFEKIGLVVKVFVKAQPDGIVTNGISVDVRDRAVPTFVLKFESDTTVLLVVKNVAD
jgi:hypothetical protein